jgi:hypothetical protein
MVVVPLLDPVAELVEVFVLAPVLKIMVPLRFSPRTTALKVPVVWKKVPFPKGFPLLLEAPAWRCPEAEKSTRERVARRVNLGEDIRNISSMKRLLIVNPDSPPGIHSLLLFSFSLQPGLSTPPNPRCPYGK